MKHTVCVEGCDDETTVEIDVYDEDWETICNLAEAVNKASECQCQPRMICDGIRCGVAPVREEEK